MKTFNVKPLQEPSFFQRLFKTEPSVNAIIEVNNLLAENENNITSVTLDNVIAISERYKTDLRHDFKVRRIDLFTSYLRHCLANSKLEEHEVKQLYHLRDILMLSAHDVNEVIENETVKVYVRHVRKAVSEGVLQDVEKENLEKLRAQLRISTDVAKEVYRKSAGQILQGFIDGAISDERLSPQEEGQMEELARNLGIDLEIDSKSKAVLDRYKLYWQIENGQLPGQTHVISDNTLVINSFNICLLITF